MKPFDFILLFFSFVYALALTHLLMTAARMIRHSARVVFSLPHALWMLAALTLVLGNWLSLWDFEKLTTISAAIIWTGFLFSVLVYLECALVSPDFEEKDVIDLRRFHEREGGKYIGLALLLIVASLLVNAAAAGVGVQKWANENALVLAMLPPTIVPLVVKKPWAQVLSPLLLAVLGAAYIFVFYPVLKS